MWIKVSILAPSRPMHPPSSSTLRARPTPHVPFARQPDPRRKDSMSQTLCSCEEKRGKVRGTRADSGSSLDSITFILTTSCAVD